MTRHIRLTLGFLIVCLLLARVTAADDKAADSAKAAEDKPATVIKGFGTVVDPDKDCQIKEDGGKLTIVIPGKHHDLTYTDDYTKLNSPRILQDVKGDFVAELKVHAFELPKDRPSSGGKFSFVSSGLLIWQDAKNYTRMDRAAVMEQPFIWVERFENGKAVSQMPLGIEDKDAYLRVERKGDTFTFQTSTDSKDWTDVQKEEAKLSGELKIGVLAINTMAAEFKATVEGLKIRPSAK